MPAVSWDLVGLVQVVADRLVLGRLVEVLVGLVGLGAEARGCCAAGVGSDGWPRCPGPFFNSECPLVDQGFADVIWDVVDFTLVNYGF